MENEAVGRIRNEKLKMENEVFGDNWRCTPNQAQQRGRKTRNFPHSNYSFLISNFSFPNNSTISLIIIAVAPQTMRPSIV